ncbi:minor capsid protein [Staphylococcus pseudoxylosus]|uniref:minor capsid protein n=1 Tax=Staphylococcus pseudoxylosus TaxID=2282419 RepID=UPI002DBC250A|nr:minor capsid protein [Staphylococcus pseudoxylosus]MEB6060839.1 minor capsid protein [Staphylococcus pseudoxylosus]
MTTNQEYWRERAKEAMKQEAKDDKEAIQRINDIVDEMVDDIEREVLAFYAKYATAEGLTLAEAKKKIDRTDIRKLENKAKQYVDNKDFSDRANKELKQYNTKMYVSREKMLQMQLGFVLTYATAQLESQMYNYMESAYYREVQRQAGLVGATANVTLEHIQSVINTPFDDVVWSTRIWKNMENTRKQVNKAVRNTMLRGRHPKEFVTELRKESGATAYQATRLLLTETARVQTQAQQQHYKSTMGDDAEYEFLAFLDDRTTQTCRHHNNKVYKVKDMQVGVNAPPMHPHCRSFTVPHVGNWRDKFFKERKGKYKIDGFEIEANKDD